MRYNLTTRLPVVNSMITCSNLPTPGYLSHLPSSQTPWPNTADHGQWNQITDESKQFILQVLNKNTFVLSYLNSVSWLDENKLPSGLLLQPTDFGSYAAAFRPSCRFTVAEFVRPVVVGPRVFAADNPLSMRSGIKCVVRRSTRTVRSHQRIPSIVFLYQYFNRCFWCQRPYN